MLIKNFKKKKKEKKRGTKRKIYKISRIWYHWHGN